ncbi:WbqC family protein [Xanthomarina gelatinilytica]|uniref:WbqC family protein n=1 Tax=Xanthomarina gelatinilytica TaxID=1137281 RepID=UPI003AA90A51
MKIAIMQPYLFPYLGYFQLIHAVDTFVFYDDVNFIKRGWINRNQILIDNKAALFTVPLKKASQNKFINEIETSLDEKWLTQFFKTIEQNYKNAPFFHETFGILKKVFENEHTKIAKLAIESVLQISNYLQLETQFEISSIDYPTTIGLSKAERLIAICRENKSEHYVNPSGGKELYSKNTFNKECITLSFIENELLPYTQYENEFVKGLSIIDVLMFNSVEETKILLSNYKLN